MIKNYIKVAVRNILRQKVFSMINVIGLSVGTACCLVLALYIYDELAYDKNFDRYEDIYRITGVVKNQNGNLNRLASTSPRLATGVKENLANVEAITRVLNPPTVEINQIKFEERMFSIDRGYLVDSTFFEVFSYQFEEGNPEHALDDPQSVVIDTKLKIKLFGDTPALGKVISIENGFSPFNYKITGVVDSDKTKSHLDFNFIVPMYSGQWGPNIKTFMTSWIGQNMFFTYVKVTPGTDTNLLVDKINELVKANGQKEMETMGIYKTQGLQPIKDIHLKSSFDFTDIGNNGNIVNVYMLASIAIFILLIACINFMNLATAKAKKRSTEVGIRKVLGAERKGLVFQFLSESIVIVFIAMVLSILLVELFLPFFNQITEKQLQIDGSTASFFIIAVCLITVFTGLLSGSYPAFYLSSFKPVKVLKGTGNFIGFNNFIRKYLVIFQFVISTSLIAGVLIVNQQLHYLKSKELGYNPEAKLIIPLRNEEARGNYQNLREALEKIGAVKTVTGADFIPGNLILEDMMLYPKGGNQDFGVLTKMNSVDYGFVEMMGIKILKGRSFVDNRESDSNNKVIINKLGMERLGFDLDNVIGQIVNFNWQEEVYSIEIIGVFENFHHRSLHEKIVPLALDLEENPIYNALIVEANLENEQQLIKEFADSWSQLNPSSGFEYKYLDGHLASLYKEDVSTSKIIKGFTALAIFISCLGLYGLSLFTTEQRVKEIGVRKVMGASVWQIVYLLSKEFSKMSFFAFLISLPVSYYFMSKWLENFSYKISMNVLTFIGAGLVAFIIIQLTVSYQSAKAARSNVIDSLRDE